MSTTIHVGPALDVLKGMPDGSVHCCVTSPPYWGLRAYKGDPGMIGMEPTFDEHLENLVSVFEEVRRVLRPDGTLWLNYGDAYAGGNGKMQWAASGTPVRSSERRAPVGGDWKPKDLMLMPARVAMALQEDGWWLRSEIIWHKPNPMPESVTDRPSCAHEKLFLFSRSARYLYDAAAVRTPALPVSIRRLAQGVDNQAGSSRAHEGKKTLKAVAGLPLVDKQRGHSRRHDGFNDRWDQQTKDEQQSMGANLRNVWTIATAHYREAHFATFPPALVEPCIQAGTSTEGVCAECGAPWLRVVDKTFLTDGSERVHISGNELGEGWGGTPRGVNAMTTKGWRATCACETDAEPAPATVLDPFAGSGTVGLVADRLQRDAVLIEISPEYAEMARQRIAADNPMFVDVDIRTTNGTDL